MSSLERMETSAGIASNLSFPFLTKECWRCQAGFRVIFSEISLAVQETLSWLF